MGITCVCSAFLLNRMTLAGQRKNEDQRNNLKITDLPEKQEDSGEETPEEKGDRKKQYSTTAKTLAVLTPIAFLMDILFMFLFKLKGGDATSLVAGTAVILMCVGAVMEFKAGSLEKVTEYVTDGFLFAIRIFAPVIVIGAFFFLGGNGITHILGDSYERGILNDWGAVAGPSCSFKQVYDSLIAAGDRWSYRTGWLRLFRASSYRCPGEDLWHSYRRFHSGPGMSGTDQCYFYRWRNGSAWGLIPVAAICNVDPVELARKNMLPVFIGLTCTFLVACLVL